MQSMRNVVALAVAIYTAVHQEIAFAVFVGELETAGLAAHGRHRHARNKGTVGNAAGNADADEDEAAGFAVNAAFMGEWLSSFSEDPMLSLSKAVDDVVAENNISSNNRGLFPVSESANPLAEEDAAEEMEQLQAKKLHAISIVKQDSIAEIGEGGNNENKDNIGSSSDDDDEGTDTTIISKVKQHVHLDSLSESQLADVAANKGLKSYVHATQLAKEAVSLAQAATSAIALAKKEASKTIARKSRVEAARKSSSEAKAYLDKMEANFEGAKAAEAHLTQELNNEFKEAFEAASTASMKFKEAKDKAEAAVVEKEKALHSSKAKLKENPSDKTLIAAQRNAQAEEKAEIARAAVVTKEASDNAEKLQKILHTTTPAPMPEYLASFSILEECGKSMGEKFDMPVPGEAPAKGDGLMEGIDSAPKLDAHLEELKRKLQRDLDKDDDFQLELKGGVID